MTGIAIPDELEKKSATERKEGYWIEYFRYRVSAKETTRFTLRSRIMKLSRIALGGLLALGFIGLSAEAVQAQSFRRGFPTPHPVYVAPTPRFTTPYYAPVYTPPVYVQPSYGYTNPFPTYTPYVPGYAQYNSRYDYSYGNYPFNNNFSYGFSFGSNFR